MNVGIKDLWDSYGWSRSTFSLVNFIIFTPWDSSLLIYLPPSNYSTFKENGGFFLSAAPLYLKESPLPNLKKKYQYLWPISYSCYHRYNFMSYLSIYTALVKRNQSVTMVERLRNCPLLCAYFVHVSRLRELVQLILSYL